MNIEIKKNLRLGFIILIIVLVIVFTLQNVEVVTVDFLWFEISMSRAILVVVLLLIGFIVGKFSRFKKKTKHLQD
jgi:uncharacterized integral membrane protein